MSFSTWTMFALDVKSQKINHIYIYIYIYIYLLAGFFHTRTGCVCACMPVCVLRTRKPTMKHELNYVQKADMRPGPNKCKSMMRNEPFSDNFWQALESTEIPPPPKHTRVNCECNSCFFFFFYLVLQLSTWGFEFFRLDNYLNRIQ